MARARGSSVRWLQTGFALLIVALFLAVLLASFPYADTITSLAAPMKLKLIDQSQRIAFPLGAQLHGVQVLFTGSQPHQLLLRSSSVTVAPALAALLRGQLGIRMDAQLYGGTVRATMRRAAKAVLVDFTLDALSLAQSRPLGQLGLELNGALSGAGSAEVKGGTMLADRVRMTFNGSNITVAVVNGLPPLSLGKIRGNLSLAAGLVTLRDLAARGPDASVDASGQIQLAPNLADSTLGLTVWLAPTARGRAEFAAFLHLLPHPPSQGPYHLDGPLMSPSLS